MARSQKPFVVEVKRGRRGAVAAPLTVTPKQPEAAFRAVAEASFAPPPEPPKPPRRILDAIEPEPVVLEVAEVLADPLKRRRGRPPKVAGAPPTPKKPRPVVAPWDEAPVVAVKRREHQAVAAVAPSREAKIAPRPQAQNRSHITQPAVTQGKAANAGANHGHLTHDDRVEAATILPRGERWKRRLPRVLW